MTSPTSNEAAVVLPPCVDRPAAIQLQRDVASRLAAGQAVCIDASQVSALQLPGVQVILAASREPNVRILNPSQSFSDEFAALAIDCPTAFAKMPAAEEVTLTTEPRRAMTGPIRVLAIDDSKTMRDMLRLTLDSAGFDVVQAVDGMDGLDVLTREVVDVIITDINMPKLDGYGVIEDLRGNPAYDGTPILVLTTESDTEKKQRARDLGATGFIVKPFDPETLVQVIHQVSPRKPN